jgi:hypothetical protein
MNGSVILKPGTARRAETRPDPIETLKEADFLLESEKAEEASALLASFLEEHDHPGVWLKLAKARRLLNDNVMSRAILRNLVLKVREPHIMDIIAARIPYTKVLVLEKFNIAYVNIPKCGSSSVKDAILFAHEKEMRRETSHYHVREFERVVPFSELTGIYSAYRKFAITRHPRDRLRSYYSKNIAEAKSLVREAKGRRHYFGLETVPTYKSFLRDFNRYRNVFDDFRHHTDNVVGYLGLDKKRYTHIFDVADTQKAIDLFSVHGVEMPVIHNMRTEHSALRAEDIDVDRETELLESFYKKELEIYFTGG